MTMIWSSRRPSLSKRILSSLFIMGAAVGAAMGVELLRRKLGIGAPRIDLVRNGRRARVRVSISPRAGRGRRSISAARS